MATGPNVPANFTPLHVRVATQVARLGASHSPRRSGSLSNGAGKAAPEEAGLPEVGVESHA